MQMVEIAEFCVNVHSSTRTSEAGLAEANQPSDDCASCSISDGLRAPRVCLMAVCLQAGWSRHEVLVFLNSSSTFYT